LKALRSKLVHEPHHISIRKNRLLNPFQEQSEGNWFFSTSFSIQSNDHHL